MNKSGWWKEGIAISAHAPYNVIAFMGPEYSKWYSLIRRLVETADSSSLEMHLYLLTPDTQWFDRSIHSNAG
jgi:hypothetical protein